MARRVLITRPLADSQSLAARLEALGFEPVIEPLLDIRFIDDVDADLSGIGALAFTSANGVRALLHAGVGGTDLPCFCVGAATAAVARDAGFKLVRSAGGDVAGLAQLITENRGAFSGAVLHVAGRERAGDLVAALAGAGIAARRLVLYRAEARDQLSPETRARLAAARIDDVVIFSPRTARQFVTLIERAGLGAAASGLRLVALSPRVAAAASGLRWGSVAVAERPDQAALIERLAEADGGHEKA